MITIGPRFRRYGTLLMLVLWFVGFLGSLIWYRMDVAQQQELNTLYATASGGYLYSVERLAERKSTKANIYLQNLAQDQNAMSDSRVAAIQFLGSKKSIDPQVFASLLRIDQPFVVRHAAATVLGQRGCEENCLSAVLFAMHSILGGQLTLEMRGQGPVESRTPVDKQIMEKLRVDSENDYLALLKSNPCLAWKIVQRDYPDDTEFIRTMRQKIPAC
ncbi:MAG TPA: HEAT repeat domain-containing protein [Terriglobales bacterium]|jgi:hypothetical protein|nr:HEAT repeat domain-containing protein [Terriglobales bacterium]